MHLMQYSMISYYCPETLHSQQTVSQELGAMGLTPRYEIVTEDGLFSIDIGVQWRGRWEAEK